MINPRILAQRLPLVLFVCAVTASCQGGCSVRVCPTDCRHFEVCDAESATCRPRQCTVASDCGPARYYACEAPAGTPTAKTVCQPLGCVDDSDCDDGRFCDGVERCNPRLTGVDAFGCVAATNPCVGSTVCDEAQNRCVGACADDADGDGHVSVACGGDDCDDNDPHRYPGNVEVCDTLNVDEDCDPSTFGSRDVDGDGFVDATCCNSDGATMHCGTDCDDTHADVNPNAPEVCNGRDDNCDGVVDYEVQIVAYPDNDHDGYGQADAGSVRICDWQLSQGFSVYNNDCNDQNAAITPGTFVCTNPQFPTQVTICQGGVWTAGTCLAGTTCVMEPTGIGVCR